MPQLELFPAPLRFYKVEFKHPWFGWIAFDLEKTSFQAAMDYRNTSGGCAYRFRIVSRLADGSDVRLEYKESKPRRS